MLALATFILVLAVQVSGRSMPMPGGIHDVELTDEVRAIAHFAGDSINRNNRRPGENWHTLTSITEPRKQTVNGYIYRMNIVLQESECANTESNDGASVETCPPIPDGVTKRCFVKVIQNVVLRPDLELLFENCSVE